MRHTRRKERDGLDLARPAPRRRHKTLRQLCALLLGRAVCAAVGALLLRGLADGLDMLEDLAAAGGLPPELLAPLVKTLGIALVSRLGTEICRDAGQGAMAAVLETAGAFGAVLVSLPLVRAARELLRALV